MSGVNVNVSVSNLPQIDRHQNDIHKNPAVNQDQNARIAHDEMSLKLTRPSEAESTQGKNVDPNQKKDEPSKKTKFKKKAVKESIKKVPKSNDEGYIVDFQA